MQLVGIRVVLHLFGFLCPPLGYASSSLSLSLGLERLKSLLFENGAWTILPFNECLVLGKQIYYGPIIFIKPVMVGAFLLTKYSFHSL